MLLHCLFDISLVIISLVTMDNGLMQTVAVDDVGHFLQDVELLQK